ncbi:MAG: hypothetical protein CMB99_04620 [Flavobacteriaceae bacterium]|nr:hypothetical protein [Flavobacteriaceae bacterium]
MRYTSKILPFVLLVFFSCVKDVDFDQTNGFVLSPVYRSAFTYFTATPAKFFDPSGTVQQNSISDVGRIDFFQNPTVAETLIQMDFLVEARNQFNRDFTITIEFQDDNGNPIYTLIPIIISANELNYTHTEVIDLRNNPQVFNTTQIVITAEVQDTGTPLNPSDTSEFEFESAIVFYIEKRF